MPSHSLEIAASSLGFLGGALLSLDALSAVTRVREAKGQEAVQAALQKAGGTYADQDGRRIASPYAARLWFARRSVLWARLGFVLITLGFFLDLLAKW